MVAQNYGISHTTCGWYLFTEEYIIATYRKARGNIQPAA